MMISAVGVLASFVLHFASFHADPGFGKLESSILFPGIFVVWVPTVLFMNGLTRDFKQRDLWKAALRGCPEWMKTALWILQGYVFFAAFVLPFLRGSNPAAYPGSFVIFPAAFYSISLCAMYSVLHVDRFDESRYCLNGHRISPLAKFCEECGAPAAPDSQISAATPR